MSDLAFRLSGAVIWSMLIFSVMKLTKLTVKTRSLKEINLLMEMQMILVSPWRMNV